MLRKINTNAEILRRIANEIREDFSGFKGDYARKYRWLLIRAEWLSWLAQELEDKQEID